MQGRLGDTFCKEMSLRGIKQDGKGTKWIYKGKWRITNTQLNHFWLDCFIGQAPNFRLNHIRRHNMLGYFTISKAQFYHLVKMMTRPQH